MLTRKRVEIIVAVVILLVLLLILALVLKKPKDTTETIVEAEPVIKELPEVQPEDVPAPGAVSAGTVARIFVERFGSYSSESNFENVDDVMLLATPAYQSTLQTLVAGYRRQLDEASGYTGISTIVIGVKTESVTETDATLLITTQRQEAVGSPGNVSVRYQDAEVNLVKSGEDWLINGLTWK
ncbi:MAG: hypothetical protein WAZ14_00485 [Patescibacteria group bacterium]